MLIFSEIFQFNKLNFYLKLIKIKEKLAKYNYKMNIYQKLNLTFKNNYKYKIKNLINLIKN